MSIEKGYLSFLLYSFQSSIRLISPFIIKYGIINFNSHIAR